MSGLATFLVGALICSGHFWVATTLAVASLLLLDLKTSLEKLATTIAPHEIFTFTKFLLLSGVILPALPNQEFGQFHINPFKTWLVVVAISTISYASYVLQKVTKGQGGIVLAALLGGAYSSTVTTVVMAKRAKQEDHPHLFAGGILIACGVMYLRLAALLALFNRQLLAVLLAPFVTLAVAALGIGWLWARRADKKTDAVQREYEPKNPLELMTAFMFAGLFLLMLIVTQLAVKYLGTGWSGYAGGNYGRERRGSVHHGADAGGGNADAGECGGGGDSDCGGEQQCGEGHIRLQPGGQEDGAAGAAVSYRAGVGWAGAVDLVRIGLELRLQTFFRVTRTPPSSPDSVRKFGVFIGLAEAVRSKVVISLRFSAESSKCRG